MDKSPPVDQESIDDRLLEDIYQIMWVSLGGGAAACQACRSLFHEGNAVTVYVFRPTGDVMFRIGFTICGDGQYEQPKEFTLGVRGLLVEGRVGWCADAATQSSWAVLLAPEVLAVGEASTKSVQEVPSGDRVSAGGATAR